MGGVGGGWGWGGYIERERIIMAMSERSSQSVHKAHLSDLLFHQLQLLKSPRSDFLS